MTQALAGMRVIDFSQVYAGPFASQQLAQLGADVIKIEQPGTGDMTRGLLATTADGMSPTFLTMNLGKRAIALDLKSEAAHTIVPALVRDADVVLENFSAGVMDRLGFGYAALRAIRPDLVYCSISGYGQAGPRAGQAAFDGAVQAASGMMAITGHPETGPTRTGYMPVDMASALNAAFAITAALLRRERTGQGQHLDVAMMDTAMVLQATQISQFLVTGKQPPLFGNRSPTRQPTANVFATADGFIQIVALNDRQVAALFAALGLAEHLADPRFATPGDREANTDAVTALITGALSVAGTAEWSERLRAAGVPTAQIRDYPEVVADPQFDTRLAFAEIDHPDGSGTRVRVVSAGHVADVDGPQVQRDPPRLGQHTDEVLGEAGFDAPTIAGWRASGAIA